MPVVNYPTYKDKVSGKEMIIGLSASGTIAKTRTYQTILVDKNGDRENQVRVQIQYPYVKRINPGTPAQLTQQARLKAASSAWDLLTLEQKGVWNNLAQIEYEQRDRRPGSYKIHFGRHLFMSQHMLAN